MSVLLPHLRWFPKVSFEVKSVYFWSVILLVLTMRVLVTTLLFLVQVLIADSEVQPDDIVPMAVDSTTTLEPWDCASPFYFIGDRCVFVMPFNKSYWLEMRYLCHDLHAELVVLNNIQFYYDLLHFIRYEGIDEEDYWIGANDTAEEGSWKWVNGDSVEFGSPFWAVGEDGSHEYYLEPHGSTAENCLYLDKTRSHYFDDGRCSTEKAVICEMTNKYLP